MNTWSAWAATIAQTLTSTRAPVLPHRRHRRLCSFTFFYESRQISSVSFRRKCSALPPNTDNIVTCSFKAPASVQLFRIILTTRSRNTSRNFSREKEISDAMRKSRVANRKCFHTFFYSKVNILNLLPWVNLQNFRARFSTSYFSLGSRSSRETRIDPLSKDTHVW